MDSPKALNSEQNESSKTETENLDEAKSVDVSLDLQHRDKDICEDNPEDQQAKTEVKNDQPEKVVMKQDKEKAVLISFKKRRRRPTNAGSNSGHSRNKPSSRPVVKGRKRRISLRRVAISTLYRKNRGTPLPIKSEKSLHKSNNRETRSQDLHGNNSQAKAGSKTETGIESSKKTSINVDIRTTQLLAQVKDALEDLGTTKGKKGHREKGLKKQDVEKSILASFKKRRQRTTSAGSDPSNSQNNLQSGSSKDRRRKKVKSLRRLAMATVIRTNKLLPPANKNSSHKSSKLETNSLDLQGSESRTAESETGSSSVTNPPFEANVQCASSLLQESPTKERQFSSPPSTSVISKAITEIFNLQSKSISEPSSSSRKHQTEVQNLQGNNSGLAEEGTSVGRVATEQSSISKCQMNPSSLSLLQEAVRNETFPSSSKYATLISNLTAAVCQLQTNRRLESPHKSCKSKLAQGLRGDKSKMAEPSFVSKGQIQPGVPSLSQEVATGETRQIRSTDSTFRAVSPKSQLQTVESTEEVSTSFEDHKEINKQLLDKNETDPVSRENIETSESKTQGFKFPSNKYLHSCSTTSASPTSTLKVSDTKSQYPKVETGEQGLANSMRDLQLCQKSFDESATKGIDGQISENENRSSDDSANISRASTSRSPVNTTEYENTISVDFPNTANTDFTKNVD